MREICASGSVGGEGGNALAYPAGDKRPSVRGGTTGENDPTPTFDQVLSCEHPAQRAAGTTHALWWELVIGFRRDLQGWECSNSG
jgi:hypothetical protein